MKQKDKYLKRKVIRNRIIFNIHSAYKFHHLKKNEHILRQLNIM